MEEKELKKALEELGKDIDKKLEDMKKATENLAKEEAAKLIKETRPELEKKLTEYNDLHKKMQEQLDAIDVKFQRIDGKKEEKKSFADKLKAAIEGDKDNVLRLKKSKTHSVIFDFETKEDMTQANSFESTTVVPEQYIPGIIYNPERTVRLRDLISQGTTSSNAVTYIQEYAQTLSNADVTTEGSEYKQGDVDLKAVTALVFKITGYAIVSEEMLEDVDGLTSYLMTRLPDKLKNEEDDQILNHSSYGLLTLGTAYVDNLADSDISRIDILVDACRQVIDDEYRPTAIVLHPTDVTLLKLTKDDNGQYIFPWIFMNNGQVILDGVPVVVTTAMTSGTFMVGDFKRAAQIFDRRQLSVEMTNTNEDNFIKGMVTVRASERIALCVYRPKAFVYGTFTAALANGSA